MNAATVVRLTTLAGLTGGVGLLGLGLLNGSTLTLVAGGLLAFDAGLTRFVAKRVGLL